MNVIDELEREQVKKARGRRRIPDFWPGDTVRVNVRIVEGSRERIQAFEGVCIARRNRGLSSSFTVRKVSYGEGVEQVFPLHSPRIESIRILRRGDVRRAKLYYLRGLAGKRARIPEKRQDRRAVQAASEADGGEETVSEAGSGVEAAPEAGDGGKAAPKAGRGKKA